MDEKQMPMSDIKLPEPFDTMCVLHEHGDLEDVPIYTAAQMQECAKQAAEMERAEWYRRGLEQGLLSGKEREQQRLYRLVADDAWAITFQTFGQYRTALLNVIRGTK